MASAKEEGGSGGSCVLAPAVPGLWKVRGGARVADRLTDRDVVQKVPPRKQCLHCGAGQCLSLKHSWPSYLPVLKGQRTTVTLPAQTCASNQARASAPPSGQTSRHSHTQRTRKLNLMLKEKEPAPFIPKLRESTQTEHMCLTQP